MFRFDYSKHRPEDCISGPSWSNKNIARWNKRAHAAHMTSVRAWADRCCKINPPQKFRAVVDDPKTIKRYRKLGVKWMDMELRNGNDA